jgi:dienelactone hydrolase
VRAAASTSKCPILITLGEHDWLDADHVTDFSSDLKEKGLEVSLKVFLTTETAASHGPFDIGK